MDPLQRPDPGSNVKEWDRKRNTTQHDHKYKTIHDNQNRLIIKCDHNYGHRNGGLILQNTFGYPETDDTSKLD